MSRYTQKEIDSLVKHIESEAKMAGLIPQAAFMSYHGGNSSYNIAAYLDCNVQKEDGRYENIRLDFVPKFAASATKTDNGKLLEAVLGVLLAFARQRENAERLKRQELSAHVARRSGTE